MSRIGKKPIEIPEKVKVEMSGNDITVTGPRGTLSRTLRPEMNVKIEDSQVVIERPSDSKFHRSLHGLTRQLVANMVEGVNSGFGKKLEIVGVGYRAEMAGKHLRLLVGFSHPVMLKAPEGITFEVPQPTVIQVSGIDKELVGMVAAKIRSFRPPEPYKGKGIRYEGEYVRRKAGKTAA
jgi:large subunit ribosomal protein L6